MIDTTAAPRRRFYTQIIRPAARPKTGTLLSAAIEGFMLASEARKLSENTIADYRRTLKRFLGHVGDTPIDQITTTQISAFLAAQPFSAKTVLNYHIGLAALWTWATREGLAERHIVRLVTKPRPQQIVVEPFTHEEIKAMLGSLGRHKDRDRALLLVLLDTGVRASELCAMTRETIDLTNRRVKVLGKGNKERVLPFSPRTASALFEYLGQETGQPFQFTRTSLAHLIKAIGKRAGVRAHPHRFRHTFAVTYLRNGGDPYTLQEILGHSTMEMVKTYLSLAQIDLDTAHLKASPVENWQL